MKNNSISYKFDKIDLMIIMLVSFEQLPGSIAKLDESVSRQLVSTRVKQLADLGYIERVGRRDFFLTDKSKTLLHDLLLDFAMYNIAFDKISQQLV